jgi:hypothetical protein
MAEPVKQRESDIAYLAGVISSERIPIEVKRRHGRPARALLPHELGEDLRELFTVNVDSDAEVDQDDEEERGDAAFSAVARVRRNGDAGACSSA